MTDLEEYTALYSDELSRFCYKLCGNLYDAEDLFQDTWTRAMSRIEQYDSSKSFKNWLFAICANIYKNSRRLKYNSARKNFGDSEENERFIRSIPETGRDIDEYLDLQRAISELPKKHKLVITLYYFREFSQKEIAQILDIPEGTVSSRLSTAKNLLRRRLNNG